MLPSRRALAAVLCAVTVVAVSACDTDEIGSAAVVGHTRITIDDLQQRVRDLAESAPEGGAATGDQTEVQRTILERMVQHELLAELARMEGVGVSPAQIDTFIEEQLVANAPEGDISALLAQSNLTEDTLRDAVHDQLIAEALIEEFGDQESFIGALTDTADELGVEVSPRYGSWDGIALDGSASGSISVPADGEPADGGSDQTPAG